MKSQPFLLLRPLPPLEAHEQPLRAMPLLDVREDAADAMIELLVGLLALLLVAACVAGWWVW